MAESEQASTIPRRTIHEAYRDALAARRQYRQSVGGPLEADAHQRLQEAVAAYYDVLRPLVESSNATEDLWETEELWPIEPEYQFVAICPTCQVYEPIEGNEAELPIGERCPSCGEDRIDRKRVPATDDDGEVQYRYVEGLKSVENIWDQRVEREVEYTDALGSHTEAVVETRLVPPEQLHAIAEALDRAMQRLSLHADVDDEAPTTTLDNDDLEAFGERLAEIREEWDTDEGIDEKEVTE